MGSPKHRAVMIFTISAFLLTIGIATNNWIFVAPGIIGALVGIFLIADAFYEPPDFTPRRWGESTWQASGRQLGSGRGGFGVVFGIAFAFAGLASLFSGHPIGLVIFGASACACLCDYFKK